VRFGEGVERAARWVREIAAMPANRGRAGRALARAVAWQLWKRATGQPLTILVFDGVRLRCHTDSACASLALYAHGGYCDLGPMRFMERYLRPGDGFLDVGANIGLYSLLAASLVGAGRVDAFEPVEPALGRFRENMALNGYSDVRLHALAVTDHGGEVPFTTDYDALNNIALGAGGERTRMVPCVRLDEFVAGRRYALGKIDVEGRELLALRGAEGLLAEAKPPVWQLELLPLFEASNPGGLDNGALASWLAERGYDLASYDPGRGVLDWSDRPWRRDFNVLAVARRARAGVEARLAEIP
jgi:FkbM family methyltransferase